MKKLTTTVFFVFFLLIIAPLSTSAVAYSKYRANYKGEVVVTYPIVRKHRRICPPKPCIGLRDGLYAGIAGGYDAYRVQDLSALAVGSTINLSDNRIVSPGGFLGGLFIGGGHYFDLFYLGAEVGGNYSSATTSFTSRATTAASSSAYYARITAKGSFTGSILPGIKANPRTLVYGRAGYARGYLTVNETAATSGLAINETTNSWNNGYILGLGTEILICNRLSARGEYSYIKYSSFTSELGSTLRPADYQVMLGLIYHFT